MIGGSAASTTKPCTFKTTSSAKTWVVQKVLIALVSYFSCICLLAAYYFNSLLIHCRLFQLTADFCNSLSISATHCRLFSLTIHCCYSLHTICTHFTQNWLFSLFCSLLFLISILPQLTTNSWLTHELALNYAIMPAFTCNHCMLFDLLYIFSSLNGWLQVLFPFFT